MPAELGAGLSGLTGENSDYNWQRFTADDATLERVNISGAAPTLNGQSSTSDTTLPSVSIEAVHHEATPGIADAEFAVTRSDASSSPLTVKISINQTATYLESATQTITIPANQTREVKAFPSHYQGTASGSLTATVMSNDDHLPAPAPNDTATVRMKVPSSNPILAVEVDDVTVTEGDDAVVMVRFVTGENVVQPRIGGSVQCGHGRHRQRGP